MKMCLRWNLAVSHWIGQAPSGSSVTTPFSSCNQVYTVERRRGMLKRYCQSSVEAPFIKSSKSLTFGLYLMDLLMPFSLSSMTTRKGCRMRARFPEGLKNVFCCNGEKTWSRNYSRRWNLKILKKQLFET